MTIGSDEHNEILANFEKHYSNYRHDKEDKSYWVKGYIYQNGELNKLYQAFILGYSFGRVTYLNS